MVLFKRSPVPPARSIDPESVPPGATVYIVEETGEAFLSQYDYFKRKSFLAQRAFVCEYTGRSNLTYAEACRSELNESREIEQSLPETLREAILRFTNCKVFSRLDSIVDAVHEEFQNSYFPGERISILIGQKSSPAIIREKIMMGAMTFPNGVTRPAQSRYRVQNTPEDPSQFERYVNGDQIIRDRRKYSKVVIRAFLRSALVRDQYDRNLWVIKQALAEQYRIQIQRHYQVKDKRSVNNLKSQKLNLKQTQTSSNASLSPRSSSSEPLDVKYNASHSEHHKSQISNQPAKPILPIIENIHEDLVHNNNKVRPPLKFLDAKIPPSLTGTLLSVWSFTTFFSDFLILSNFSFDDFLQMVIDPSDTEELYEELHCALLNALVTPENEIDIDWMPSEIELSTDGSKMSIFESWDERLARKDFSFGGWQTIIKGLLECYMAVHEDSNKWTSVIEQLSHSKVSIINSYLDLDITSRTEIMHFLMEQIIQTTAFKECLDGQSELMAELSKERNEMQRTLKMRKDALYEIEKEHPKLTGQKLLKRQRVHQPSNSDTILTDIKKFFNFMKKESNDPKPDQPDQDTETVDSNLSKSDAAILRNYNELYKDFTNEEKLYKQMSINYDEANSLRVTYLGKDRFYNCYYWFERKGLTSKDRASYCGYNNARLWVHGTSIDLWRNLIPKVDKQGVILNEEVIWLRRSQDEGPTRLDNLDSWGFYETPEEMEALMTWLNPNGIRERELRIALANVLERVVTDMNTRIHYLARRKKEDESDDVDHIMDSSSDSEDQTEGRDSEESKESEFKDVPVKANGTSKHVSIIPSSSSSSSESSKASEENETVARYSNKLALKQLGHFHSEHLRRSQRIRS